MTHSKQVQLTRNFQTLMESTKHGTQRTLNIKYSISKTDAQYRLLGMPANTYTQKIKYTATVLELDSAQINMKNPLYSKPNVKINLLILTYTIGRYKLKNHVF